MRALIFDGKRPTLARHHPEPDPDPGSALVRTVQAGVSSLDLELCQGLLAFRGVLGHEFVGRVEAVAGPDARGLAGRRVVGSIGIACGACDLCQAGLSAHCRSRALLGMHGHDGCFADRFCIPVANLVPLPDTVDDDHAVFAEPLAAVVQTARQLTIEGKPYITVLGDGTMGLLMVQVLARLNASVRLIGRHRDKLAVCEKWGIKHRHVDDVGRRADQDIVVDCTGAAGGLALAFELVRPRGQVVMKTLLAGSRPETPPVDLSPVVLNEIQLIGSHRGPVDEAVSLLARREIDVVSCISRRMTLDDGPAVLEGMTKPGTIKVLLTV